MQVEIFGWHIRCERIDLDMLIGERFFGQSNASYARGRADAKQKGVKFGRKPTLTPHQQKEARKRLEAGETQRSVARNYAIAPGRKFCLVGDEGGRVAHPPTPVPKGSWARAFLREEPLFKMILLPRLLPREIQFDRLVYYPIDLLVSPSGFEPETY